MKKTRPIDAKNLSDLSGIAKVKYFDRTIRNSRFKGFFELRQIAGEWAAEFSGQCGKFYIAVMLD